MQNAKLKSKSTYRGGTRNRQEQAHEREHGHRQRLTNTMTGQGVKGTHRLCPNSGSAHFECAFEVRLRHYAAA